MMTRLINEATLHRREGTGRSYGPPRPLFSGQGKVAPFPYTNHLGFLPSAFCELSPQSCTLASGSRSRISLYQASEHPASTGPLHPARGGGGEDM